MRNLVCGIDLGTTRVKAALFGIDGSMVHSVSRPVPEETQKARGSEFDPEVYYSVLVEALGDLVSSFDPPVSSNPAKRAGFGLPVDAIAIASQRATLVPICKSGNPSGPALSWQDTRCGAIAEKILPAAESGWFTQITGLPPGALWSLAKILWLREKRPGIFRKTMRLVLLHDYVLKRLGADDFYTDPSNASLTGLLDIRKLDWSHPLLDLAGIDTRFLPSLVAPATRAGGLDRQVAAKTGLASGTPLFVGGGDQQCSALGVGIIDPGRAALGLGTAMIAGCPSDRPVAVPGMGFMCTCHMAPNRWMLEGIHNSFGGSLKWARILLGLGDAAEFESLAGQAPPGSGGAVYLPFLAGAGTPDYDSIARGAFFGLDLSTNRACLARAAIEGVCLEARRVLEALGRRTRVRALTVSGGGARGSLLQQVLADMTGCGLFLSDRSETTMTGAAMVAATGAGWFGGIDGAARSWTGSGNEGHEILPALGSGRRNAIYRTYLKKAALVLKAGFIPKGNHHE